MSYAPIRFAGPSLIPASPAKIYTAVSTIIIKEFTVTNFSGSTLPFSIFLLGENGNQVINLYNINRSSLDPYTLYGNVNVPNNTTVDFYIAQPSSGGDRPVLFGGDTVDDCSVLTYSKPTYCLNTATYSITVTANTDLSLVTAVQEGDLRYC